jgi:hypothetical protein
MQARSFVSSMVYQARTTALHSTPSADTNYDNNEADDTVDSMIEQARRFAFDDAEYNTHYHPYRDEDERLQQAQFLLQHMLQIQQQQQQQQQHTDNNEDIVSIVETLQQKIHRNERKIAKRKE